jgi:gliding motility-associated protein GldL
MSSGLNSKNNNRVDNFFKVVMPKVYGIGAAVVIAGAMFKLLNWPGGALMLGLGLSTEAIIFILSAFEPQHEEVDWTKVYPELNTDYQGEAIISRARPVDSVSEKLDELFSKAQIDQTLINKLGEGMSRLADSVSTMANLSQVGAVTEQYAVNMGKASEVLESIYESHTNVLGAVRNLADVSQGSQQYYEQVQQLTGTLSKINVNYQEELKETQLRLDQSKAVFERISESINKLQEASNETENFKQELSQLSEKLASLNSVYGNMLTALKS